LPDDRSSIVWIDRKRRNLGECGFARLEQRRCMYSADIALFAVDDELSLRSSLSQLAIWWL